MVKIWRRFWKLVLYLYEKYWIVLYLVFIEGIEIQFFGMSKIGTLFDKSVRKRAELMNFAMELTMIWLNLVGSVGI